MYSMMEPLSGLIGRRIKWSPKIGTKIITALADFNAMLLLLWLNEFSNNSSIDIHTAVSGAK